MKDFKDLLCEIGVEELPHSVAYKTALEFREKFLSLLKDNRIAFKDSRLFSTPRRFSLHIKSVASEQEEYEEVKRGPSMEKAYQDGKPTKALLGFCKANGIKPEEVEVRDVKGSRYVFAVKKIAGKKTVEMLPGILDFVLSSLHFPKTMRWEESNFAFIRPIRWILLLFGTEVIPYRKVGIESSNYTFGHRVYSKGKRLKVDDPDMYESILEESGVIPDREKRLKGIKESISSICEKKGVLIPEEAEILFDINTDLTEYPVPVECSFDEEFLSLPPEVLISEMVEHQKYFPLVDESGKITSQFIVVSNIKDNSKSKVGFERVLKARLNDGKFFFEEDKKRAFGDYLEDLKRVSFHPKLGSMAEKVERIGRIAEKICDYIGLDSESRNDVNRAVKLCKNDLATYMVNEFPNLQGVMGFYYALESGYNERVARAVRDHYLPRYADDRLPEDMVGAIVGIADRLDSIIGIFSTGYEPKGSKDPYGLRRAVFGIIKIIVDKKINLSVRDLIKNSIDIYPLVKDREKFLEDIYSFFKNRVRSVFEEIGYEYDEIDAAMANVLDDIYEAYKRVEALHNFRRDEKFKDLFIAFKRMANIIDQGKECDETYVDQSLLTEKEERELYSYYLEKKQAIEKSIKEKNYTEFYTILGSFKPFVDNFFDNVLVMDEDIKKRCNRIALLREIIGSFSGILDFSKLVVT